MTKQVGISRKYSNELLFDEFRKIKLNMYEKKC